MNVLLNSLISFISGLSYGSLCVCDRGLLGQVASERAPRALKPKTTAETFKEKQTKDDVSESDVDGGGDDENHKKHMEI